jgi:hypothetical protein
MQSLGVVIRRLLSMLIVLVMVIPPAQLAAAAVRLPQVAEATECARKPCDCDKAGPDCLRSATCASQCAQSPMAFAVQKIAFGDMTAVFDRQESVEPQSRASGPPRRPPRI